MTLSAPTLSTRLVKLMALPKLYCLSPYPSCANGKPQRLTISFRSDSDKRSHRPGQLYDGSYENALRGLVLSKLD